MTTTTRKDLAGEVAFLARELKTPVITETFAAPGDQAREEGWSHEEYLAAVFGRQIAFPNHERAQVLALDGNSLLHLRPPNRAATTGTNQQLTDRKDPAGGQFSPAVDTVRLSFGSCPWRLPH